MSWTPCELCGSMLWAYEGSACTNPECANHTRGGPKPPPPPPRKTAKGKRGKR